MTVRVSRCCVDCKQPSRTLTRGRCARCKPAHDRAESQRRNSHPRAAIYKDPRWRKAARACLDRDRWRCVDCGRHRTELQPNERLGADHQVPVLEAADPYDVDNLQARCSTCSGAKDGRRAHPA